MNLEDFEDLNNFNNNLIVNQEQSNDEEYTNNWIHYCQNLNDNIDTMWNFILYNQFNNEEIRRLQNQINNLEKDNHFLKNKNKFLKTELDFEINMSHSLKRKIGNNYDDDYQINFKKRNILKDEYENLIDEEQSINELIKLDDKNNELKNIFKNISNINDIINLQKNKYKYHFIEDDKFIKLYNLIPVLEELNNIIGMDNVKDTIFNSICYFLHGLNNKKELNHVMITGPPGVGKSTVASIIGKIYLQLGFLENNKFINARRSDLIGKYLGHTADKTQSVINKALGGVLFIDEVYSLGNPEGKDSFSKECIDTINQNMTEFKKPWLLIIGGYKEEIESSFLSFNRGLERRFTVKLNIERYSAEELYLILLKFIKDDKWEIEENALSIELIEKNIKHFKFFAGDMQKLFQKAKHFYSLRLMKTAINLNESNKILIKSDFEKSVKLFISKSLKKEYILPTMYT